MSRYGEFGDRGIYMAISATEATIGGVALAAAGGAFVGGHFVERGEWLDSLPKSEFDFPDGESDPSGPHDATWNENATHANDGTAGMLASLAVSMAVPTVAIYAPQIAARFGAEIGRGAHLAIGAAGILGVAGGVIAAKTVID